MKFFDRTEQLAQLREMKNRSYDNHSMLTVVTGRRRIGKTTLIDKSMSGEEYLYFSSGRKRGCALRRVHWRDTHQTWSFRSGRDHFIQGYLRHSDAGRRA